MGAMKVTELVQQIVDLVLERQLGEDSDRFKRRIGRCDIGATRFLDGSDVR
jgi:hypothetical protein